MGKKVVVALLLTILLASAAAAPGQRRDHHEHHDGEEDYQHNCGCVAAAQGFTINCQAVSFVQEAFRALEACGSCTPECKRNYYIVQVRCPLQPHSLLKNNI